MDGRVVTKATRRFAQAMIAALLVLAVGPLSGAVAAPILTINESLSGTVSKDFSPEFSGTTTDENDPVTVRVYHEHGGEAEIPLTASPAVGAWSAQSAALSDGTYTAIAEQTENGETEHSSEVTFTVDTNSPTVTLKQPDDTLEQHDPDLLRHGHRPEQAGDRPDLQLRHEEVSTATANGNGGTWSSGKAATPATDEWVHTRRQQPRRARSATKPAKAGRWRFTVNTDSPAVTLNQPPTPSNNTTPTFSGTATDPSKPVDRPHLQLRQ